MRHLPGVVVTFLIGVSTVFGQPTVTFEKDRLVVKGITGGGRVGCYGIAHDYVRIRPELLRWEKVEVDTDGDGEVSVGVGRAVPLRSLWLVVDLETGQWSAATPDPTSRREVPGKGAGLVTAPDGTRSILRQRRAYLDVLVARPAVGVWVEIAGDGSEQDADRQPDGVTSVDLAQASAFIGSPAAPKTIDPKDVVIAVDPDTLEFSAIANGQR